MRIKDWEIFALIIILTFSFLFYAVCIAYSQWYEYVSSYYPLYYPTSLFNTYGIQTPTYSYSSLYAAATGIHLAQSFAINGFNMLYPQPEPQSVHYSGMMYGYNGLVNGVQDGTLFLTSDPLITNGIFDKSFGDYPQIVNTVALFNQEHAYMPGTSSDQQPKLSIQKCLLELPHMDMGQCILLRRSQSPSVSSGHTSGHMGNIVGSESQFSAIPSTDYLSLYFICFEGTPYKE